MGLIISRFRKKKSTKEVLEQIQKDVVQIEEYGAHTQQRQNRVVKRLLIYSAVLYLVAVVVFYFYYYPPKRWVYVTPFVVFPFLIYLLQCLMLWYYRRKISKNELKLQTLKERKTQILEQVMETETYKVAKEILELYAPDQLRKTQPILKATPVVSPAPRLPSPNSQHSEVRRRVVNTPPQATNPVPRPIMPQHLPHQSPAFPTRAPMPQSAPGRPGNHGSVRVTPSLPHAPPGHRHGPHNPGYATPAGPHHAALPRPDPSSTGDGGPPGPPMPRPVLPRERGYFDRFVEYLVGDGPANRFALVCRQCESHNGMALKDEFPYLAFRCAYCYYWNPARKQRPCAPRLEELMPQPPPPPQPQEEEEDEDDDEEEQESSSGEEEEDEEEEEEDGDEGESGGSSSGEDEDEGGASSSEQSSNKATSSQEGSLENVAKSTPSSSTSTDPSSTSEDPLHHPANMCPPPAPPTSSSSTSNTTPSTENDETE